MPWRISVPLSSLCLLRGLMRSRVWTLPCALRVQDTLLSATCTCSTSEMIIARVDVDDSFFKRAFERELESS